MKKILIALAAVTTLAAGASAAQAKVHLDVNVGLPGFYGSGYYGGPVYVADDYYYDEPSCHYVKIKKVKWHNGQKYVTFKKKLICNDY